MSRPPQHTSYTFTHNSTEYCPVFLLVVTCVVAVVGWSRRGIDPELHYDKDLKEVFKRMDQKRRRVQVDHNIDRQHECI